MTKLLFPVCSTKVRRKFFAHLGYSRVERRDVPEGISTTREFSSICPASSVFMLKHL